MLYDNYLTRDYERQQAEGDWFVDWAENEGYDLDDPEQAKLAERDYESYILDAAEAAAEAAAEQAVDRMLEEYEEDNCDERAW